MVCYKKTALNSKKPLGQAKRFVGKIKPTEKQKKAKIIKA
jgi:hypothetical protein